jgi:hypothetical protein
MYVNGGSPPDLVWVAETAKRYTQYVEHNRKGRLREQESTGRGPIIYNGGDAVC